MGAAQHDAVALHADLHCLTLADIQRAAHFDRDHDPAKLVDAADNTGKFHVLSPLYAVITKSPQILYLYFTYSTKHVNNNSKRVENFCK